jgi:tetratricopeptide (TPR) repeat protein
MFTKKESFAKQTALYLQNAEYEKAYELAKQFVIAHPSEITSNFLLAKSCFWTGKYDEAKISARKAFNLSTHTDDIVQCAMLAGHCYYQTKEYSRGIEILKAAEKTKCTPELKKLLFTLSCAMDDHTEASTHLNELYELEPKSAHDLVLSHFSRKPYFSSRP